jgi:hypothetical protein
MATSLCKACGNQDCEDRDCYAMLEGMFYSPEDCHGEFKLENLCELCKYKEKHMKEPGWEPIKGSCSGFRHVDGYWMSF